MYNYVLTLDAEEDIVRIYEYGFERFGLMQADIYFEMMFNSFDSIAKNPFLYLAADPIKNGYRYCVCGVDTIYFKIATSETVQIITIIGKQDFR